MEEDLDDYPIGMSEHDLKQVGEKEITKNINKMEAQINVKDLDKSQRAEWIVNISKDAMLLKKIENPTPAMCYEAVKSNEKALDLIEDKNIKSVLSSPLFKKKELDSQQFENMYYGLEWSPVQKIFLKDGKTKEGRTLTTKSKSGQIKTHFIEKYNKFDINKDPISKHIKSDTLKQELEKGNMIALKDLAGNVGFYKKDQELNRIVSVPRISVNIPKKIGEYELSTIDMNDLLMNKTITNIPFKHNGINTVVSIAYDQKKNNITPTFVQSKEKNQEVRTNKAVKTMKTISKKTEQSFGKKDEKAFKEMIDFLDKGDISKFNTRASKYKLPKSFITQNILNNKSLSEEQKVYALLNGAKMPFREITKTLNYKNKKRIDINKVKKETQEEKIKEKQLSNEGRNNIKQGKEKIKGEVKNLLTQH